MEGPLGLSKKDVARTLIRHHFAPCKTALEAFYRLRSIQFDPIAPVGCNHDLVLQSRVAGYKIGDWQKLAYQKRQVYDGWDKQASLVPYTGWPLRRYYYNWDKEHGFRRIFNDHPHAVDAILKEIERRGPLMPRECEFQERKEEWAGSWYGPSLSKVTLRALWHAGMVMTTGRKNGHHIYDLTERVVPRQYLEAPEISNEDALIGIVLERHHAMGILRPSASGEIWSDNVYTPARRAAMAELVKRGELVEVDVEGVKAHATPAFLSLLDQKSLPRKVRIVAPLDQLVWDRKMIQHLFGFDYIWEIYTPEHKRKWGYYVLPVLDGNDFVARIEFHCRKGVLEIRQWHTETKKLGASFYSEFEQALLRFMDYCGATKVQTAAHVDAKIRELADGLSAPI